MTIHPLPPDYPRSDEPNTFDVPHILFDGGYARQVGVRALGLYVALVRFAADNAPREMTLAALGQTLRCSVPKVRDCLRRLADEQLITLEMHADEVVSVTLCSLPQEGGAQ